MKIVYFIKKFKDFFYFKLQTDGKISYSQSGEDLILDLIFLNKNNGFYIDIGANHPIIASNTYYFYKKGWRGINIDSLPSAISLLKKKRKYDINIEAGISDMEGEMKFYMFKSTSYNTFNSQIVKEIAKYTDLLDSKTIYVKKLSTVLNYYPINEIDFFSIDVEGLDFNVLKSNDWAKYRPKVIVIEDLSYSIEMDNNEIFKFLSSLEYIYFCRTVTNSIYIDKKFYKFRFNK